MITGLSGTATISTDKQGIYDRTGLPPGRYEVHSETRSSQFRHTQCGVTKNSSRAGDKPKT